MENNALQFLEGGGEMGKLIREKDWSQTAVGAPEFWPQSLRTALSIIIHSRFPMFLFWGSRLTCFYNDAYRPSLGKDGKHPTILGNDGAEAWTEIWDFIQPIIDSVLKDKQASWNEDQLLPIYRNGKMEDVYWTFSYSPVIDESGAAAGVFVTCTETTEQLTVLEKLKNSSEQLAFAIDAAELGTYDYSPLTGKFTANKRLKNWFGLPEDDEINLQDAIDAISEEEQISVSRAIAESLQFESGGRYDVYYTIVNPKDKSQRYVHAKGKATFDHANTAYRLDGTLQDVTPQFQEMALREEALEKASYSANHLSLALSAGKLGWYEYNVETDVIDISDQFRINFGLQPDEFFTYTDFSATVHPEDIGYVSKAVTDSVAQNTVYDATYRIFANGEIKWIHASGMPVRDKFGNMIGLAGVTDDITEQKNSQLQISRAIDEIEFSRQKLNIVIEASELGMFEMNIKTGAISSSARFAEIFGHSGEDVFDIRQTSARVHPEDMERRNAAHAEAIKNGALFFTGRLVFEDDSIHWIESKGKVFYEDDGSPGFLIGTVRDITEERHKQQVLLKSEQKFRLLADSMPQYIWTSDTQGKINYFNRSILEYSGLSEEKMHAEGWLQIVHREDLSANRKTWLAALEAGTDFMFEHRFRRHDGAYRWQLSRAIPQRDEEGNIQMWVGTSTDIQDQRTFTEELENRVVERTQELLEKNVELEEMNKELQTFAYISSHDLQEPLRKIQTFVELLKDKEGDHLSFEGSGYFDRIQKAAIRMQTLINDLLAYSRAGSSERVFENISLNTLIHEIKDDIAEELLQANAVINVTESCDIYVIHYQFRQLLHNLISNSLKFKKENSPVIISISCKPTDEDFTGKKPNLSYHTLSYSDNGIGFDQKYADKIFDLFQRLHGRDSYEGTGIGLSIVKKIVDNHSGTISAKSEKNKGATFQIYFPDNQ